MQNLPAYYFPIFFLTLWLAVTALLGVLSGWFSLMQRYPDQKEEALLMIQGQSGSMGMGVRMNHILKLSVCPSGLRIGISRFFGPLCRSFFVPWDKISIERKKAYFFSVVEFRFGHPANGRLAVPAYVANRLAKAARDVWPETGEISPHTRADALRGVFYFWLLGTSAASLFFLIVPRLAGPRGSGPPWWIAIGFPAVLLGIVSIDRYRNVVKGLKD